MAIRQKTVVENVYLGRDNVFKLKFTQDNVAVDMSGVTRMVMTVGDETVDSDTVATAFDWTLGNGEVSFALGATLTNKGTAFAELVIYDPTNTNGLVWFNEDSTSRLELRVW